MKILDRYVLQKVFLPFIYCFLGFLAIWFIFDLSDNLQDFLDGHVGFSTLVKYYQSQIPQVVVMSLPTVELLAVMYALTAMSRTNEIISMLGSGLSVLRILVPLFFLGLVLTGVAFYFNYESAPHAEMVKKEMLKEIKRGKKIEAGLQGYLYRNSIDRRTWFIRKLYNDTMTLSDVQVIQQNADDEITAQWYARDASFDAASDSWKFSKAKYAEYDKEGNITKSEFKDIILVPGWRETPQRINSTVTKAEWLSAPELMSYLDFNSDFPEKRLAPYKTNLQLRYSVPFQCLIVILIGAPLGIVYSRRGILGGVILAITLFFGMIFLGYFFASLGKGDRVSPLAAGWTPIVVFFLAGVYLLWLRSTNRDLPKLKLPWMA